MPQLSPRLSPLTTLSPDREVNRRTFEAAHFRASYLASYQNASEFTSILEREGRTWAEDLEALRAQAATRMAQFDQSEKHEQWKAAHGGEACPDVLTPVKPKA